MKKCMIMKKNNMLNLGIRFVEFKYEEKNRVDKDIKPSKLVVRKFRIWELRHRFQLFIFIERKKSTKVLI